MRYCNGIIVVTVISLLYISPALAGNNSLRGVKENWNRQSDNLRDRRQDRQEQRQDRWNDRREYRRDQWNNMRDGSRHFRDRGDFSRRGRHNGRGHH